MRPMLALLALGWAAGGCASPSGANPANDRGPSTDASLLVGSARDATADEGRVDDANSRSTAMLDARDDGALPGWTLTWSDEFDGPDGSAVDPSKWSHEVGGGGWGNRERQYYTDGTQNAVVKGGSLVITATTDGASQYGCWYGTCQYTSARLRTLGSFAQQYGRFEARMRLPFGQGLWPAFWMLGSNVQAVHWPACGEIDVMENVGFEPSSCHGSLHAPGFPPAGLTARYSLPSGASLSDGFHTFAIEWDGAGIRFYVDDQLYETQTPGGAPAGATWAFDHSFFMLLNVAVGGNWPGDPNATTSFPQTMNVDWVRVYQRDASEP
jgi:beta-glucanase (GH16 family)